MPSIKKRKNKQRYLELKKLDDYLASWIEQKNKEFREFTDQNVALMREENIRLRKDAAEVYQKAEKKLDEQQIRLVEVLGIFTAILAFVITFVQISVSFSAIEAFGLIIAIGIILIIFIFLLKKIIEPKAQNEKMISIPKEKKFDWPREIRRILNPFLTVFISISISILVYSEVIIRNEIDANFWILLFFGTLAIFILINSPIFYLISWQNKGLLK
ncbi:MAG: hypothetical protein V1494_06910 [Candidatus Diapherotrites archaeon]